MCVVLGLDCLIYVKRHGMTGYYTMIMLVNKIGLVGKWTVAYVHYKTIKSIYIGNVGSWRPTHGEKKEKEWGSFSFSCTRKKERRNAIIFDLVG